MEDETFDEVTQEELAEMEIEWASSADEVYADQYLSETYEEELPW